MKAILALEDGSLFTGRAFGAEGETHGEVVFNTSVTGYQEIFTDPSYAGQIVVMTYPHIGNCGVNDQDEESSRPHVKGIVAREFSECASNWCSQETLDDYLKRHGIVSISEVDTRALVRHIRSHGTMRGIISTVEFDPAKLIAAAKAVPTMKGTDLTSAVSCSEPYARTGPATDAAVRRFKVIALDYGIRRSMLENLVRVGCDVTVVPAATSAADVLAMNPVGVFLSNGPGDPEPLEYAVKNIRALFGKVPLFGICLGHQLMGRAFGGKTYKLKFGHHGANHPVKNLKTGRIEITSQHHSFAIDPDSLDTKTVELTHVNLNDQTLEGIRHRDIPAFSVQYHPGVSPGTHASHCLFDEFKQLMVEFR